MASVARFAGSGHSWRRVPLTPGAINLPPHRGSLKADTQTVVAEPEALSDHRALADPVSQRRGEAEPQVCTAKEQAQRLRENNQQTR